MFEALRAWCQFPIKIHTYTGPTAAGDQGHASPVTHNGYRVDLMEEITDKFGEQYVSATRVYFPEEVSVTQDDLISFEHSEAKYEIRRIGGFYDGNTGKLDISVIYL